MAESHSPYPGIRVSETDQATILSLLYTADPNKGLGKKVFVEAENMEMSPWLYREYMAMADKGIFRQEYLIDFEATQGARLFYMEDEATLVTWEKFKAVKESCTIWYGLDPHPRVPHAHLWCAVDPYGERWYYREFWPSKMYGKPGNVPEDDNRVKIKQHVEVVKYLESAENPENNGKSEKIYRRVIDYAARAFGQGTVDDEPQLNFQERYEKISREVGDGEWRMNFVDCVKDHDAGIELVNDGLKPLEMEIDGRWQRRSKIHIVADKCPELVYQIHTNRYPKLTALQADTKDPLPDGIQKRRHFSDCLRYIEMDKPRFIRTGTAKSDWSPMHSGVNY